MPIQSRCGVNGKLIVYPRAKQWYENIDHIVIAHTKVTCCREGYTLCVISFSSSSYLRFFLIGCHILNRLITPASFPDVMRLTLSYFKFTLVVSTFAFNNPGCDVVQSIPPPAPLNRLSKLLRDLLHLARPTTGRNRMNPLGNRGDRRGRARGHQAIGLNPCT